MAVLHRGKGKRQVEGKPSGGRLRSDIVRRKLYSSERVRIVVLRRDAETNRFDSRRRGKLSKTKQLFN